MGILPHDRVFEHISSMEAELVAALARVGDDGERRVVVERLAAVPPSRTPAANPFTGPIRRAVATAWERPPLVQPRLGGTTPDFVFTQRLGVPSLLVPYAPPDMHHHAPNERMELSALYRGVRTSAAICLELSPDFSTGREASGCEGV